ncbi:MAG: 50S ribosomal protein L18 [Candidatus Aenigmatarchaeota archaeon]
MEMKKHIPRLRRRLEQKTDYDARLKLIKSGKPRLVIRRTNKAYIVDVVAYEPSGDKVIAHASGFELKKYGWKYSFKNLSAAYLAGFLCGMRSPPDEEAVVDLGLHVSSKGAGLYAAVRGAVDAGINVPWDEKIAPPMDRIKGKHIADYAKMLKLKDVGKYGKVFSAYLKNNLDPEKMEQAFEEAKKAIAANPQPEPNKRKITNIKE